MAVGVNRLSAASAYKIYLAGPKGQTHIYCLPKGPTKYCADPESQQNIVLTKGTTKYCADPKGQRKNVALTQRDNKQKIGDNFFQAVSKRIYP